MSCIFLIWNTGNISYKSNETANTTTVFKYFTHSTQKYNCNCCSTTLTNFSPWLFTTFPSLGHLWTRLLETTAVWQPQNASAQNSWGEHFKQCIYTCAIMTQLTFCLLRTSISLSCFLKANISSSFCFLSSLFSASRFSLLWCSSLVLSLLWKKVWS